MARNRKKCFSYRFNGYPHRDSGSIHSVGIEKLSALIAKFIAKLADPHDPDDKRWTAGWLARFEKERQKKIKGLALKQRS